jgi:hypothetical protein
VPTECVNWQQWQQFFAGRSKRQLPKLNSSDIYADIPESVARSLAIFQLGESGGGTVIEQARRSALRDTDHHYANAIELFVAEEHRHAEILAICVRNLGGSLIRKNWTAKLFVFSRRMMGLRLKILVLLAAEVVGICYYHLIATRLPASRLQSLLAQIVNDERAHLHFHCSFLRTQAQTAWRRRLFKLVWRTTMLVAAVIVLIDHRKTLDDLGLKFRTVWRRWQTYSRNAEILVTGPSCEIKVAWNENPESSQDTNWALTTMLDA